MNNTITNPSIKENREYEIPQDYIYWKVQWFEKALSEEKIMELQARLLSSILITWDIKTFQVLETERLQGVLFSRERNIYNYKQTIDIQRVADPEDRDWVIQTLNKVGAGSSVFERYAWRSRFTRNISRQKFLLQTQTCRI